MQMRHFQPPSLTDMNQGGSSNVTALRRLMTEYKQLTSGGSIRHSVLSISILLIIIALGSPDGMFTAGTSGFALALLMIRSRD
jgi:hypothetical protein